MYRRSRPFGLERRSCRSTPTASAGFSGPGSTFAERGHSRRSPGASKAKPDCGFRAGNRAQGAMGEGLFLVRAARFAPPEKG